MNKLPKFLVQNPPLADPQMPAPYRFKDTAIQIYQVPAAASCLNAVCDRLLNDVARQSGSGLRFRPITAGPLGTVNILLMRYPSVVSLAPGYRQFGASHQNELSFAIPIVKTRHNIPVDVGLFTPYLWVDNALSVVSGREVIGFPKVQATFTLPQKENDSGDCRVESLATVALGDNERVQAQPIFSTREQSGDPMLPDDSGLLELGLDSDAGGELPNDVARQLWPFGHIDDLYGQDKPLAVGDDVMELLQNSAGSSLQSYCLKQFRDAETPDRACYQAIVQSSTDLLGFQAGGVLRETQIELPRYATLTIIDQLGLKATGTTVTPISGFWYRSDFGLDKLRNLTRHALLPGLPFPPAPNLLETCLKSASRMLVLQDRLARKWLRALE